MKLSIKHSKEFEVARIQNTINRLDWYLSNGYKLDYLNFPKTIDRSNLIGIPEEIITKAVEEEYDEIKFVESARSTLQMYTNYETRFEEFVSSIGLSTIPEITVYLTNYGIGGSYHLPNNIIINISKYFSIGLMRTVLHEMIHLHIQPLIDKYGISQWEKETLVDLLFEKAFPELLKKQSIPIPTNEIEQVFHKNYPNIEKIISLVSTKSP